MKTLVLFILLVSIFACQREVSRATGWQNADSLKEGGEEIKSDIQLAPNTPTPSTNVGPITQPGDKSVIDGVYVPEHVPTKRAIPYEYVREANGNAVNGHNPTKQGYAPSSAYEDFDLDSKGKITCGEQNDLAEWEFWNDLNESQLTFAQQTWGLRPSQRMTFVVQNENKIPLSNAKVEIISETNEVLWTSRTDNTGITHLFGGLSIHDSTRIHHAKVTHIGQSKEIEAVQLFEEGINQVVLDAPCQAENSVDIAFVVDATGSMSDEINFLKDDLLDIIQSSTKSYMDLDLHLGALFYRCEGNEYVTKHKNFSPNPMKVLSFIKQQEAHEGGDEVVSKALTETINELSWRESANVKLLFMLLDEAPKPNDRVNSELNQAYRDAAKKGIKIIPCVASGIGLREDRKLEYLMRVAAITTNGTYVYFTNDSGIGNNHTKPLVKSTEVKTLNALLKEIISKNLDLASCEEIDGPVHAYSDEQSNAEEELSEVLDSLQISISDSAIVENILPFTDFETLEELNENRPLTHLDTTALLDNFNKDVISMKVYPLPASWNITVEVSEIPESYTLLDAHGRAIRRNNDIEEATFKIDLLNLPRGQYFLQVLVGETILRSQVPKL